jgi:hypothetical protein
VAKHGPGTSSLRRHDAAYVSIRIGVGSR